MQDYRQPASAPNDIIVHEPGQPLDGRIELELATPWQRIAAYLINTVIYIALFIPMLIGISNSSFESENFVMSSSEWISIAISMALLLAWGIYQAVIMSKYGQSFGKKIMKIRVADLEGNNPGFVGTVLLREVVFNFVLSVIGMIPVLGVLVTLGVPLALVVMLFTDRDRRTLQDILAKTIVIKAT